MVALQLTPEQIQPNVMVEIDHGPPMGLHQEAKRPLLGSLRPQMTESTSAVEATSRSASTHRPAEHKLELISNDECRCAATSLQYGGKILTGTEGAQMRTEKFEGGRIERPQNSSTSMSLPRLNDSNEPSASEIRKEETIVVGMTQLWSMEDKYWCGRAAGPYFMCEGAGSDWTSSGVENRTSFDVLRLPDGADTVTTPPSTTRIAGGNEVTEPALSHQVTEPFPVPLDQPSVLDAVYALRGRSFKRREDVVKTFMERSRMVEARMSSDCGYSYKNPTCFSPVHMAIGRFAETRSGGPEATGGPGFLALMSWAAGPKTSSIFDAVDVSRDILMWMIEYNLITSPCEKSQTASQPLPTCRQRTSLPSAHAANNTIEIRATAPNPKNTQTSNRRSPTGLDRMDSYTSFASYNMTLDDMDPSEIEAMMQQIQWEQTIDQATIAEPHYDTASFDPSLSPLSGYASPSSMTTGSTNPSPLLPLLDYDMSFPMGTSSDDLQSLFPELMDHSTNMDPAWMGAPPEGFASPFPTSGDQQAKVSPLYSMDGQLYPTAAPDTTTYSSNTTATPYLATVPSSATTTTLAPAPSSSSSPISSPQNTPTTNELTCPHCGAAFTDKTKLKVHTNKHTKPFRCAAAGCAYATAEKKSLQRHLLAKSKWDEGHRTAARSEGVRQVRHRCPREGCTYATVRDDNLKRHMSTCAAAQ